jgi:RNA polymerase sigma-70 factor (ECF subfamily)
MNAQTDSEDTDLATALAGDQDAFQRLIGRYVREILLHCYRMLGSFHDAEDALQEVLLRAWRYLPSYEGRSTFRAWLYRIATNVCLKQGARKKKEPPVVPPMLADAIAKSAEPWSNLTPYPDALLVAPDVDPAARYDLRESVQLAFLAAVQLLPPRQRAVLILRDVLGWSANEVAELLDSTVASANGALNRARATLEQQRSTGRLRIGREAPADNVALSLVRAYIEAWDAVDVGRLAKLLRDDVVISMPPLPLRYQGIKAAGDFYRMMLGGTPPGRLRRIATSANLCPALAIYRQGDDNGLFRAWGIFVFGIEADGFSEVTAFLDPSLPAAFNLPAELSAD